KPSRCSRKRLRERARSCGTDRWASSRCRRSPREPSRLRARSRIIQVRCRLWAEGIPCRQYAPQESRIRSPISPPVAERLLNSWKARRSRAWKLLPTRNSEHNPVLDFVFRVSFARGKILDFHGPADITKETSEAIVNA